MPAYISGRSSFCIAKELDLHTMYSKTSAEDARENSNYDLPTAVTFLLAGLGLGYVFALLWSPRSKDEQLRQTPEMGRVSEVSRRQPRYRFP